MNSDPNFPYLPGLRGGGSPSPPPPPAPANASTFMSGSILINAFVALIVVIFFVTCYRMYMCAFWRRRRRDILTSWRPSEGETLPSMAGLDKAIIDSLPAFTYKLPQDGASETGLAECAVCLVEFQDNDSCRLLPVCRHSFHSECIDKWFISHATCPMCRMHPEMVQSEGTHHENQDTRPCLWPYGTVEEQRQESGLRTNGQESSNQMRSPTSRSIARISLREDISNDNIHRTRSDSLFASERELEGLGLQWRQMIVRTFSNGTYGNYGIVGEETARDGSSVRGDVSLDTGCIAPGDGSERNPSLQAQKLQMQRLPLPNWHRSASDKCLHMKQGLQLSTTSALSRATSLSLSSYGTHAYKHGQMGGKSSPHISNDLLKRQDAAFPSSSASSSLMHGLSMTDQRPPTVLPNLTHNKPYQSANTNQNL